jgi:hypothetical protein
VQLSVCAQEKYPENPSAGLYSVCLVDPAAAVFVAIINGSSEVVGDGWTHTGYGNGLIPATVTGEAVQKCTDALKLLPVGGPPGAMCE